MNRHDRTQWLFWGVFWIACFTGLLCRSAEPVPFSPPPADWPTEVEVGELLILNAPPEATGVAWSLFPPETGYRAFETEKAIVIKTRASGTIIVAMAEGTAETVTVCQAAIMIGEGEPGPNPGPFPGPIIEGKLHVLLLYETAPNQPGSLSQQQEGIPTAKDMLEYLGAHCVNESGTPAFRFLDKDADIDGLPADWQEGTNRA